MILFLHPPPTPSYPSLLCILPSSISRLSRLWPHHSPIWCWEGYIHLLRPDRSALHHAGADSLCPEAHVPSGLRSSQLDPARGPGTSARYSSTLHSASDLDVAGVLCGASGRVQHSGRVLVAAGCHLLLFHLTVHHRTGWLRTRRTAGTETQIVVQDRGHGWV